MTTRRAAVSKISIHLRTEMTGCISTRDADRSDKTEGAILTLSLSFGAPPFHHLENSGCVMIGWFVEAAVIYLGVADSLASDTHKMWWNCDI